jgi:hypothetical protein
MARKVIDTVIDLGCEIDALDRCPGFREMCWTGDSPEAKLLLEGAQTRYNAPWPQLAPLTIETLNKLPRRKQRGIRKALADGPHAAYDRSFLAV